MTHTLSFGENSRFLPGFVADTTKVGKKLVDLRFKLIDTWLRCMLVLWRS